MADKKETTAMDWANLFLGAGTTYLEYDKSKQQAELNAMVNKASVEASPVVAQANAEVASSKTEQLVIGLGVVAVALLVGVGALKLMKKW